MPKTGPGGNVGPQIGHPRVVSVPGGIAATRKLDADVSDSSEEQQAGVAFTPVDANGYALTSLQINITLSSTLQLPEPAAGQNLLYGPQLKIGSSSCMALRVIYLRAPGDADTTRRLDVYDTCTSTEYAVATIDSAFMAEYASDLGDGDGPAVSFGAVQNGATNNWQLVLWPNAGYGRGYSTLWTGTQTNPTAASGKAIFFIDTFQSGACPSLPTMHVWNFLGFSALDPAAPGAALIPLTAIQPINVTAGSGTPDCFNPALAVDPYYYVYTESSSGFTTTTAIGPTPTPSPSPSPTVTPHPHKTPEPTPTPAPIAPMVFSTYALPGFTVGGPAATLTVSEVGYLGSFSISSTSPILSVTCAPVNCAPASAGGSVTLTLAPGTNGKSTLTVTDSHAQSNAFPFEVVAISSYGVNTGPINPYGYYPSAIAFGSDGNLWYTIPNKAEIGRMTPSGTATVFPAAAGNGNQITSGPDGNLWFTSGNPAAVNRITTSGVVTQFLVGSQGFQYPSGITTGADGNLWFGDLGSNKIGRMTIAGQVTAFSNGISGLQVEGMAKGPDGNVWFTEGSTNRVGKISPAGVITEYWQGISEPTQLNNIAAGPDGNMWYSASIYGQGKVGRVTMSGVITEYTAGLQGANATPEGLAAGPDGNVWFADVTGQVGNITPSGTITEFSDLISGSQVGSIVLGPNGKLWYTDPGVFRIGSVTP